MALKSFPGSLAATIAGIFGAIIGVIGSTQFNESTEDLYVGNYAIGSTIFPADPISGDKLTIGGHDYVVYRTDDDAGVPDANGVNCTGDAGASSTAVAAQFVAAITADNTGKVSAGRDGGVGYFQAKDAGMNANIPIAASWRTRATATDTDSSTVNVTGTLTATETATKTDTVLITATGVGTATDNTWSATGTETFTSTMTFTVTETVTLSGTVTASNSVLGTVTATVTDTETGSETWLGTGTNTATAEVTGEGTDTTTGSTTATQTVTYDGSVTVTATKELSGTVTSTYTTTGTGTSIGTSTGMWLGTDSVANGGPQLGLIDNSYNPETSGLICPLGSTARTVDGTKAWTKVGTDTTDWAPINTF